jgi:hypothetical protein
MEAAKRVGAALTAAGITWALGGSAVLIAHGLRDQPPSDWDLTTDVHPEQVMAALAGLPASQNPQTGDGIYATEARIIALPKIDLMVRFAIRTEVGTVHLPTIVSTTWEGLPVGAPEVWAVAYRLMGRPAKADLLSGWLWGRGADPAVKSVLLAQLLPPAIRSEVESWPERGGAR